MDNANHKYEDASNTWSEIDWSKIPDSPTMSIDISATRLHTLNVISDKYEYAMAMAGKCERLAFNKAACDCAEECALVRMHLKWRDAQ